MNVQFREPLFKANFTLFVSAFSEVVTYLDERAFDVAKVGGPRLAKALLLERDGESEVVLWFQPTFDPTNPVDMGVLAHEALHAVHFTLRGRGVEDSSLLDEVGNYFIEWLVREIAERVMAMQQRDGWADTGLKAGDRLVAFVDGEPTDFILVADKGVRLAPRRATGQPPTLP